MQVQIKQEPKVFKPVTLEITFESEEGLKLYRDIMGCNLSVPSILYEEDNPMFGKAGDIMTRIYECVNDVIRGI